MAMAPEILTFMPNGDVTLKLIRHVVSGANPNPPRSITDKPAKAKEPVLDEDAEIEAALGIEPETLNDDDDDDDDGIVFYAPDAPGAEDGPLYPPTPRARGSDASRRDRSASPPASFWAALKRQAAQVIGDPAADEGDAAVSEIVDDPQGEAETAVVESHEAWCICSSRHLILSSRYFETILSGEFKEAKTLRTTGHVEIEFWEDDLDSMVILLNIIHGASRKVPRTLDTDNLTKLAVLVSKFGMLETVDFFSDTWIDNLQREGLPKGYTKEILKMLYVFWVFDREKEFGDMTRLVQREADEKIEEDVKGLMIPGAIVDAIKHARVTAISTAIDTVQALITKFMDGTDRCDAAIDDDLRYACDAMVLGSLLKSSRKIGIWPKPEAPFLGRRWRDLAKKLRGIKVLDVCNKTSSRRWNSHGPSGNAHGIEDEIEGVLKDVEKGLEGLNLKDFAGKIEDCIPVLVPEAEAPDVPAPVLDAPASSAAHEHSDSVPEPQMTGNFAPDSQISCHTDEGVDVEPSEYEEYYEDPSKYVTSIDHRVLTDQRELDDDPAPPMHIIETINMQEPAPSPPPELELRVDSLPRPQPPQAPRTRGRSPPRAQVREEKAQPEMKQAHSSPSLFSWPKNDSDDTPGHEVAIIPKSQLSSGFLYQEAKPRDLSPRNNIHDVPTRKAVPTTNSQQDYRPNGSKTPPTTGSNQQIHHSPPAPSTNGTDLRLKSSPRNSIQGAAFPKPAPVPPPHQSPRTSPNGQTTPTESQSSKNGSPTSYFPSHKEQEAYAQRKPQALLRHNTNEKPPIPKSTQVPPLSQNNPHNNNQTTSAQQRPRRANSIPLPPSPREESQPARGSATSMLIAAEKHIARNTLYHAASNGAGREDVRSPPPVGSRASSIDDAATMDNSVALLSPPARIPAPVNGTGTHHHHRHEERNGRSPPRAPAPALTSNKLSPNNEHRPEERNGERNGKPGGHAAPALAPMDRDKEREKRSSTHNSNNNNAADRVAAQRKSPSPPAMAMAAVHKGREARPETNGRESPLKQMMTSGDENDDEVAGAELAVRDVWSPPKEGFRVRKGKKIFTNRFSS